MSKTCQQNVKTPVVVGATARYRTDQQNVKTPVVVGRVV